MSHNKYLIILLIITIVGQSIAMAAMFRSKPNHGQNHQHQQPRQRSRQSFRNRDAQMCHLREINSCLDKIQSLNGTSTNSSSTTSSIITTSSGLDKLCSTIDDSMKCMKNFFKKCATPLQRELYDLTTEQFQRTMKKFCNNGPEREMFLKSSPCIHGKVLSTKNYKQTCNRYYLRTFDYLTSNGNNQTMDERVDLLCCSHNQWENCTERMIVDKCGKDSYDKFQLFLNKLFNNMGSMICPKNFYPLTGKLCKQILPLINDNNSTIKLGGKSDNFLAKYLQNYLSFIITNE